MQPTRRTFLGTAAVAAAVKPPYPKETAHSSGYARTFTGRQLAMLAFPLGGVAAGSLSLGGRGQLRDWEIFNRPDKGNNLSYALPSIWAQVGSAKPVAHVLEARYQPPYEGQDGLGSQNAPGLSRLAGARFTGEFPLAHIEFNDDTLPVHVSLEAFSPFIPHNPDDSGLPVAILRYRVTNPNAQPAQVAIAWSIENPVGKGDKRANEFRTAATLSGLTMTNPALPADDVMQGSFALAVLNQGTGTLTHLKGWPAGRWWNSPLLFWDDFSSDGELGPEATKSSAVGAVCLKRTLAPHQSADYEFLLAWHFPNRTPARCGWKAPKGDEHTVIGNWYCTRFPDAWAAAEYASQNLPRLEQQTKLFVQAVRETTIAPVVLEAAMANLSTLRSTTSFRTADGEFHGFEGVDDHLGCCFGNCTHVWNYETSTAHIFPSFARSLRKASFGFSQDEQGAMHFRQVLPDGKERSGYAAADGQMGQIIHAYLDWSLSGDREWLTGIWPRIKKAIEFAWIPGGWDANRDGVMEGVQHNTYDVEFYGPNPLCGVYYLGALRSCEEMARVVGETDFAAECRRLFGSGSQWMDANLFNGEYYEQQIRSFHKGEIANSLRSDMGADDPEHPEYQVGKGCLVDQLLGQSLADVCGLGPLLKPENMRRTLESIYRYNFKKSFAQHDNVQRTFVLNDEAALVVCDYGKTTRPRIPFPYFAEVFTGLEYATASHMLFAGMHAEGVECISAVRRRYDGERRNPWDEAECGHHYARAMAAWSGVVALSGFRYNAGKLSIQPKSKLADFRSLWSTGTGWGTFSKRAGKTEVRVLSGHLPVGERDFREGETFAL
jgi:non-lysosomal glucosylceramidase